MAYDNITKFGNSSFKNKEGYFTLPRRFPVRDDVIGSNNNYNSTEKSKHLRSISNSDKMHSKLDMTHMKDTKGKLERRSYIQRIADDAVRHYERARNRKTALFYDVVRRGDVTRVKAVVDTLKSHEELEVLKWLLSTEQITYPHPPPDKPIAVSIQKYIVAVILTLLTLITTPLFYAFHGFLRAVTKLRTNIDLLNYMDLPYFYALLSENEAMLRLFHAYGADASSTDSLGNNIFHYLTDIAIHDTGKALALFKIMMEVERDNVNLRYLLTEAPNRYGLTAQEYMAERGAFVLLRNILHTEGIICKVISAAADDQTDPMNSDYDNTKIYDEAHGSDKTNLRDSDAVNNLMEFRMSEFEGKDYGFFRSLVECQHAGEYREHEIISKQKWPLLKSWVRCKVSMFLPFIVLSHIYEIAFTGLLVYYLLNTGGDHNAIPLAKTLSVVFQNQKLLAEKSRLKYPIVDLKTDVVFKSAELFTSTMNSSEECSQIGYTHIGDVIVTPCLKTALEGLQNKEEYCDNRLPMEKILKYTGIDHHGNEMLQFIAYYTRPIHSIFLWLSIIHVTWDGIHRLVFLWLHVFTKYKGKTNGLLAFVHVKFPGSYISKQLLLLSYMALLRFYLVFQFRYDLLVNTDELSADRNLQLFEKLSYLMVTCFIARGLYHLYSLRLLPSIGQFVIAMFKMGETLLNFSIVYLAVMFIFSVIFHFMMRQDNCPALKKEGFESILSSMFYTFKLLNKHATFPFPHPNPLIIVTYICYTSICCLLLLNLLIASMKITCTRILKEPWISFLRDMERINEVIAVEFRLMFLRYLLPRRMHTALVERAGCDVEENSLGKTEIYLRAYEHLG